MAIRRRRRLGWLLWLGYLPGVVLLTFALRSVIDLDVVAIVVALAWMGAAAVNHARLMRLPCPRCAGRFHVGSRWHNPWTRRCLHCGLHVRADEGAV